MGVPQLKESCCGCTLQTGSKIIGWFHLVSGIICFIVACLQVSAGKQIRVQTNEGVIIVDNPMYTYSIVVLVGVIIGLIIAICLLYGAYKRTAGHCLAWVIYNVIGTTIVLISTLYSSGVFFAAGYTGIGLGNLFGGLIAVAISAYLILVVNSFYLELKHGPQNVATYNTA